MEETPEAEAEVYGKILLYMKHDIIKSSSIDKIKKWIVFRLEMDGYDAHLCNTSWFTPFGPPSGTRSLISLLNFSLYNFISCTISWLLSCFFFFNFFPVFQFRGEYEYVDVMMRDQINGCDETMRLIVDIDFKTQFELARPTPNYQELINALPHIFVGTQDKLEKLISFVCTAAKHSLTERGLHIPPWRKQSYMHSKWLSHNCKKLSFSELSILNNYTPKNGIMGCFQDFLQVQKCGGFKFWSLEEFGICILVFMVLVFVYFQPFWSWIGAGCELNWVFSWVFVCWFLSQFLFLTQIAFSFSDDYMMIHNLVSNLYFNGIIIIPLIYIREVYKKLIQ